jgi:hypothetical protein
MRGTARYSHHILQQQQQQERDTKARDRLFQLLLLLDIVDTLLEHGIRDAFAGLDTLLQHDTRDSSGSVLSRCMLEGPTGRVLPIHYSNRPAMRHLATKVSRVYQWLSLANAEVEAGLYANHPRHEHIAQVIDSTLSTAQRTWLHDTHRTAKPKACDIC